MRKTILAGCLGAMASLSATKGAAQVADSTTLGVTTTEVTAVAHGWSAKKQVLDKTVYNDQKENIGEVQDIIIAPDKAISYAIMGGGSSLGSGLPSEAVEKFIKLTV